MKSPRVLAVLTAAACGGTPATAEPKFPDATDPAYAASFDGEVDSRVSTSAGEPGGYVVLWPRLVPADRTGSLARTAGAVQSRLVAMVEEAAAGHPVDVRPEPERVCPSQGCVGASAGAVILHSGGSCAVVAVTSTPGPHRPHLVQWVGRVVIANPNPPFRDPPESHIRVDDFVPCTEVADRLQEQVEAVELSIRSVHRPTDSPTAE